MFKPVLISDKNIRSKKIKSIVQNLFKKEKLKLPNVAIIIGGDGFMLQTLRKNKNSNKLFYGINSGNYGFLMNRFSKKFLTKNISSAKKIIISPLEMKVITKNKNKKSIAINEVSILRQSRQAANLTIKNNSKIIIKKLVSDGVLISTPAGSTAYNFSVNGPILSLNSKKFSIAPISAFRPRKWSGKIIEEKSKITIINLDPKKRPVSAVADNFEVRNAVKVIICKHKSIKFNLLYDKSISLQKKNKIRTIKKISLIDDKKYKDFFKIHLSKNYHLYF